MANKIGTCDLAIIANYYDLPFYVAASYSTLDLDIYGKDIPIELRDDSEIFDPYLYEILIKKEKEIISKSCCDCWPNKETKIKLYNPAFDITPESLITKIILDIGVYNPQEISSITLNEMDMKINEICQRNVDSSN